MSYAIVFQTIVLENNGKIYHFSRSGCNNDDYGRTAEDFTLKIYDTKEQALKDIERFKGCFDDELKINSKFVSYDYYYNYLKKKIENPLSLEQFKNNYYYGFLLLKSVNCLNNNVEYKNIQEFNNAYYDLLKQYNTIRTMYNYEDLKFEDLKNDLGYVRIYIASKPTSKPRKFRK